MTPELDYLVWSVLLLIGQIAAQAVSNVLGVGIPYAASAQDDERRADSLLAGRLKRALANFNETYAVFVALALTLAITQSGTEISALGAAMWFWARVVFVFVYAAGIPWVRTVVWAISILGLLLMLWPLLVA